LDGARVTEGEYRMAWIGFAEPGDEGAVRPVAHAGDETGYLERATLSWTRAAHGHGPVAEALRTGKPLVVQDIATDPITEPWRADALAQGYASSVLDFSTVEAGKLELDAAPFSLRERIGQILKTLGPMAHAKGLELCYEVDAAVPEAVVGDAGRLGQILTNLVGNAIKFTERGDVTVSVAADAAPASGHVMLHVVVRDTGRGISPDKQLRIFQAFEQGDSSTTRQYGGTGLGLAITRRLAEPMGGRAWVESQVGTGSTFHVTVQVARTEEPVLRPDPVSPPVLESQSVLVVDDHETNRRFLQVTVAGWGMKPALATGAESAVAALRGAAAAVGPGTRL
jgi:two-component system sensor histidine kinase/response regulator